MCTDVAVQEQPVNFYHPALGTEVYGRDNE